MADVTAIVVAYRSGLALEAACASVLASSGIRVEVRLVNNDPTDHLPHNLAQHDHRITLLQPGRNLGFCAAVNLAIGSSAAPYVALVNPDARVDPDYVPRLVGQLDSRPSLGSAGGRILRRGAGGRTYIDSTGLAFLPGRRHVDRAHGKRDDGRRLGVEEVFGVTAAAAVYRTTSLRAVAVEGQILPQSFFMYLDDVDLAWRLQAGGYRSLVDHAAIAWHERRAAMGVEDPGTGRAFVFSTMKRHIEKPDYVRTLSLANHALMLIRNDDPDAFLGQLPAFMARRLPLEVFTLAQRPNVAIDARRRILRGLPGALRERAVIQAQRVVPTATLRRWIP